VLVEAETQAARAMRRSGWSRAEAQARIAAQMPLAEKNRRADLIINNEGPHKQICHDAQHILGQVRRMPTNAESLNRA
jgi:dephospho-CoA kinase